MCLWLFNEYFIYIEPIVKQMLEKNGAPREELTFRKQNEALSLVRKAKLAPTAVRDLMFESQRSCPTDQGGWVW